jgi:predicted chitinase
MSLISEQQFRQMMPHAGARLDAHWPYINPALEKAAINTPSRIAAFLAQLAHESGEYRYMEELASGADYEGREDLGNVMPGDGVKYKGHGPIQVTGRTNHMLCGQALKLDLINNPRLICEPQYGTASACWFWNSKALSALADRDWFLTITRRVNGGFNGLTDRIRYWNRNRVILGLSFVDTAGESEAIKKFQRDHGLTADGVIGPKTFAALNERRAA